MKPEDLKTFEDMKAFLMEHSAGDRLAFSEINRALEGITAMLKPVYEAFTFSKDVDKAKTDFVVKYSKYIGLFLKAVTLIGIIWAIFKFGVSQASK